MIDDDDDEDDETIVIDREPTVVPEREEEHTIVLARRRPASDIDDGDHAEETIVIDRDAEDRTIALGRRAPAPPVDDPVLRLLPGRARPAVGPNVVESYPAREPILPGVPVVADTVERGRVRPDRAGLPSVVRRSRRAGIRSLVVFAAACVVSIVGIVVVIAWFVRG